MGVQKQNNSNEDQDSKVIINCSEKKKVRTLPDVAIYRPPALRRTDEGPSSSTFHERKPRPSKQRRPDIAVYVPRALRGTQKPSPTPKYSSTATEVPLKQPPISLSESEGNSEERIHLPHTSKTDVPKKISLISSSAAPQKSSHNDSSPSPSVPSFQPEVSEDPLLSSVSLQDSALNEKAMCGFPSASSSSSPSPSKAEFISSSEISMQENECSANESLSTSDKCSGDHRGSMIDARVQLLTGTIEEKGPGLSTMEGSVKLEYACSEEMVKSVTPEKELRAAEKNCIEVGDNAEKETHFGSSVHSDDTVMDSTGYIKKNNVEKSEDRDINVRKTNNSLQGEITVKSKRKDCAIVAKDIGHRHELSFFRVKNPGESENGRVGVSENGSEDDSVPLSSWEELFDLPEEGFGVTKGDSKTHKLMEEVVTAVGRVNVVEKARCNYTQYRTDNIHALAELSHVVEVYGFPAEFKTQDLISVLSSYGGGSSCAPAFEIKWVDDTHALAVFASSFVAADVLSLHHPMVKTRSLEDASVASKAKARKTCESLRTPFRPRPETCAALAQRLITGALGVNHRQTKAEREEERRLLREAREKRRNAAKERDAAWEGTIGSTL